MSLPPFLFKPLKLLSAFIKPGAGGAHQILSSQPTEPETEARAVTLRPTFIIHQRGERYEK